MPETDLNWLSATEQAALIRRKKVSPVEIVDALPLNASGKVVKYELRERAAN